MRTSCATREEGATPFAKPEPGQGAHQLSVYRSLRSRPLLAFKLAARRHSVPTTKRL